MKPKTITIFFFLIVIIGLPLCVGKYAYGVPIRSYWTATVRDTGREVEILGP